ncbi:phosphoenolpyruvate carboxylase [Neokomagataea thailandica NBRC 106555]|uniref:Phosphoenolpyruvate carboxylase n=2 Tax=Neokomagataea TaxID=1223423 RepID=A0A4Y6V3Q9_9PROT|nr:MULTISPECIES: phosphoenolpyruvate carboxylase [Neokomagataea]QDH24004.1 phosphoenolpyruvate carboxylase [Neokomagataea tanensis]GBR50932.1 phosphoenolpyruvate carboxylase [Neokomagataea thailandica NBRC 106555]
MSQLSSRLDPTLSGRIEELVISLEQEHDGLASAVQRIKSQFLSQEGTDPLSDFTKIVHSMRDELFAERAVKLRSYVGLENAQPLERLKKVAQKLVEQAQTPQDLACPDIAAVFTAHPTFALADNVYAQLAQHATAPTEGLPHLATHRRASPPTLNHEQTLALEAILRGRDALDELTSFILSAMQERWGNDAIASVDPSPVILASWVGFDTDGRTDIGWWDTLRIRLELKLSQLSRLEQNLAAQHLEHTALAMRVRRAIEAVRTQHEACPTGRDATAEQIQHFALTLLNHHDAALENAQQLTPFFRDAAADLSAEETSALHAVRAGFMSHGLGIAHIHTRLNAAQIYNVARSRLGLSDDPALPRRRRVLMSKINAALDELTPRQVDFGALMTETASAARLMMTMAQILKHVDSGSPIRFLIAETESGYTLLATLWLARFMGIQDHQIEISPLFETESALENGETILEEAFRSPHWRNYLRANGRLSLQFGYSDSGRYVGQLAATNLVERLRMRTLALLKEHGLEDVSLTLFDTHGESIGRGAHPFSLRQRLNYFSPARTRAALHEAGIRHRVETAFQGGDGYTLFGTHDLAASTIATLAEHITEAPKADEDPIYARPDFAADFFSTIALDMAALVDDPGYAALLSAFGPSLIDKTGSRPSARQSDASTVTQITHPSQLRAIPNNAILQQLGWWANVLHGLGNAAQRHPETFEELLQKSPRFQGAMDFARQALAHSDLDVLRATIRQLDPGTWLDRASQADDEERRQSYLTISDGLEALRFWTSAPAMFRRIQADNIALRSTWPEAPRMAAREKLLHALRFALIDRIWLLASQIPYFGPRSNLTRDGITQLALCLDIPRMLHILEDLFPLAAPSIAHIDFGEPRDQAAAEGFIAEHEQLFRPLARHFELLREIGIAIMHANRAFG